MVISLQCKALWYKSFIVHRMVYSNSSQYEALQCCACEIKIDKDYVKKNLGSLVKDTDLSKFIL